MTSWSRIAPVEVRVSSDVPMVCGVVGTAPSIGVLNASGHRIMCRPPIAETPPAFLPVGS